ncbi:cysteine dioxygenase type 1 [Anthonomus grandis grandis]|uniref:cysteine dioxygenase type 1 n=1 Tax=Anthonomus grandis grandis TaxID=2921223 RepID=UPI00216662D4|nr:cysteine dioxygenase type 1 [Anthonomus grandis grandis]
MSVCQYRPEVLSDNNRHQDDEYCEIKLIKHLGRSLPEIGSLTDLIRELNVIFEKDNVNVDLVRYVMNSYKSNPVEWKKFAKFDRFRYTRNLVDDGNGKYNLMLLCWGEGHGSGIHDHANSHCFMKILQGSLEEIRFGWPKQSKGEEEEELKEIGRTRLNLNEVCYINDSLGLHRVENVSSYDTAISLHLYCPPYDRCSVFNQRNGKKTTSTVTFYSMYGKRTKNNDEVPVPEDN